MPVDLALSDLHFRDLVREGETLAWPQGPGEPLALSEALIAQRHDLRSPSLFLGMSASKTVQPEHAARPPRVPLIGTHQSNPDAPASTTCYPLENQTHLQRCSLRGCKQPREHPFGNIPTWRPLPAF